MNWLRGLSFVSIAVGSMWSVPAAARYYYCTVSIPGSAAANGLSPEAVSGIIYMDAYDVQLGDKFLAYVRSMQREAWGSSCQGFETFEEAVSTKERRMDASGQDVDIGWTNDLAAASRGRVEKPAGNASGAFLIVENNGIAAGAKAWEDTVLEGQRQDAAARARQVTETARASAKHQAMLAKFFEEMRKRGNKQ